MSAYHCCIPKCINDSRHDKSLSFHSIPTDPHRKKSWLIKIRRDEGTYFKVKPHTKVCSAHFKSSDFTRTLTGIRCLTKDAFPSIFAWNTETPTRKPPKVRQSPLKRKKLELSNSDDDNECPENEPVFTPQPEFHDYIGPQREVSAEEKLTEAVKHIEYLEQLVNNLSVSKFGVHRFATDPKMLVLYRIHLISASDECVPTSPTIS